MSNYFEVGSREDIVISNSSLSYINPEQGGSPAKFLSFFEQNTEKKQSISLERGTLLHDWHEHQDGFIVADIEKPSEMMCGWVDRVFDMLAVSEGGIANYSNDIVQSVRNGAYASTKDATKLKEKFESEGLEYLKFLFKGSGKVALTPATKIIIDNQINSLLGHKKANHMLFGQVSDTSKRIKELEIYWSVDIEGKETKFKAKLDNTIFDYKNKVVYLNDLKSTGKPVSLFKASFISFRYYRQIAFYINALFQYLIQQGEDPKEWSVIPRMVAVDNTPNYNVHCFTIDNKWIEAGNKESQDLISRVAWHVSKDEWKYSAEEVENKYDLHLDFNTKDQLFNGEEDETGL